LAPPREHGTVPAVLQFNRGQAVEGSDPSKIFLWGRPQGRLEVREPPGQTPGFQLVLEAIGSRPDLFLVMTKASEASREGSSRRLWLRAGWLRLPGGGGL
jgi:hypothetical protein